ncbi:hypothetical protein FB567DRAFT_72747 [Paraphoma chrysanthemicola]|uniref:Uncharacterized protein n=1 Tax=Paraphoma chrysanthemicola TaxID=798071 RepID=A0A8K0R604_9PLEO|nr:hypothetical protein FB567DRAFT_72747 [Paraphoma chrysanthemicola]
MLRATLPSRPINNSRLLENITTTSRLASRQNSLPPNASHHSTQTPKPPTTTSTPPTKPTLPENPSLPSFNLFHAVRDSRSAVRYTVYAGLGLMATVESTFWYNVLKAKFFPSKSEAEKEKAARFLESLGEAVKGYRGAWMGNYWRYYGGYVWGVGER